MVNDSDQQTLYFLKRIAPIDERKYLIIPFKNNEVTIGRTQGISFTIHDLAISRKHAIFRRQKDNSGWTVTNLSCNGVLVNGTVLQLNKEQRLPLSSTVQFCANHKKFVYKFTSKKINVKRLISSENSQRSPFSSQLSEDLLSHAKSIDSEHEACVGSFHTATATGTTATATGTTTTATGTTATTTGTTATATGTTAAAATGSTTVAAAANTSTNTTEVHIAQNESLLREHKELEQQLLQNEDKYTRLLHEKQELAASMAAQQQALEHKYQEEREALVQQVSDERQLKMALRESEEALALQLQQQVEALKQRLEQERQDLEQMLQLEEQRKTQLENDQVVVRVQMAAEREVLQAAMEQERGEMQEQMAERVQEVEKQMQEQLQHVQERLQQKERVADSLTAELQIKSAAAQRLEAVESDKAALEEQLQRAREEGKKVTELTESVTKVEQEKMELQQEMEMMEFAVMAEAKKAVVDTVEEVIDSEMQCPICNELFIKAILLNCSHTFCQHCIDCWKKQKRDCPSCRAPITSQTRSLTIDNFIEKIVQTLSTELKKNRADTIKEREEAITAAEAAAAAQREQRKNRVRGGRRGTGGSGNSNNVAATRTATAGSSISATTSSTGTSNAPTGSNNNNSGPLVPPAQPPPAHVHSNALPANSGNFLHDQQQRHSPRHRNRPAQPDMREGYTIQGWWPNIHDYQRPGSRYGQPQPGYSNQPRHHNHQPWTTYGQPQNHNNTSWDRYGQPQSDNNQPHGWSHPDGGTLQRRHRSNQPPSYYHQQ